MMQFVILSSLIILAVISPGPDFIIVTKNALNYNRVAGIYTAIGVSCGAILLAMASILGLVIVITRSATLFSIFKFVGAAYLIYLGFKTFFMGSRKNFFEKDTSILLLISNFEAFKQGFLCSSLNPKAMLFLQHFLRLFLN